MINWLGLLTSCCKFVERWACLSNNWCQAVNSPANSITVTRHVDTYKCGKIRPLLHVSFNSSAVRPSFKNMYVFFDHWSGQRCQKYVYIWKWPLVEHVEELKIKNIQTFALTSPATWSKKYILRELSFFYREAGSLFVWEGENFSWRSIYGFLQLLKRVFQVSAYYISLSKVFFSFRSYFWFCSCLPSGPNFLKNFLKKTS